MKKTITVRPEDRAAFRNLTNVCVGTGRVDLALHREYQEELRAVQAQCHFQMIRGHGIFSDQMGIYQTHTTPDGEKKCGTASPIWIACWTPGWNAALSPSSKRASCPPP